MRIKYLAQVHNIVPRVRLKSTTPKSGMEHSTWAKVFRINPEFSQDFKADFP